MTRVLFVPGRGVAGPGHWQSLWVAASEDSGWVPRPEDSDFDLAGRVAAVGEAVAAAGAPVVLVAHSAGCHVVGEWARAGDVGRVVAAMLVAPPFLDPERREPYEEWDTDGRHFIVRDTPLPFPTTVVGSRTDPYATYGQTEAYARAWGAKLVDAGDAGHIQTSTGHGPWPVGERVLAGLLGRE